MLALVLALTVSTASIDDWNVERLATNRNGMFVLGGWAVANLVGGAIGFGVATDETWRYFHLGNLVWNGVNVALAVVGLISNWKPDDQPLDLKDAMKGSQNLEKVFFLNVGLDVAYLATAAFLWQRGDATNDRRFVGFGQALLLQGGFLFAFDLVMAFLNLRLSNKLFERLNLTPLGLSGTF
ncbi:MAG: hypothetical protein JNK82_34440 [Myxococcaceae bacterium]|nr:hypothetical protein [Myxococcaceae bacterium]